MVVMTPFRQSWLKTALAVALLMPSAHATPEPLPELERCWKASELVCWPLGSEPATWQQPYLQQPGTALLCKNGVCEPIDTLEV